MSGGFFNYNQYQIDEIKDEIECIIKNNKELNEWTLSRKTLKQFKKAVSILNKASVYTHNIDAFLSGDNDEKSFHKNLKKELK